MGFINRLLNSQLLRRKSSQDWARQQGPHGGTFWLNGKTGEKRYQDANPGGDGGGAAQQPDPSAKVKGYAEQLKAKFGDQAIAQLDAMKAKVASDPAKVAALDQVRALLAPKDAPKAAEKPPQPAAEAKKAEAPAQHGMVDRGEGRHIRFEDGKPLKIHDTAKGVEHIPDEHIFTDQRPGVIRSKAGELFALQIDPKDKRPHDMENNVGMVHRQMPQMANVAKHYGEYTTNIAEQFADLVEDADGSDRDAAADKLDEAQSEFTQHLELAKGEVIEWMSQRLPKRAGEIKKEIGKLFDDLTAKTMEGFDYIDQARHIDEGDRSEDDYEEAETYAESIREEAKYMTDEIARIGREQEEYQDEEWESDLSAHEEEASDLVNDFDGSDPDDEKDRVEEFNRDAEENNCPYKIVEAEDGGWTWEERSLKGIVTKTLQHSPLYRKSIPASALKPQSDEYQHADDDPESIMADIVGGWMAKHGQTDGQTKSLVTKAAAPSGAKPPRANPRAGQTWESNGRWYKNDGGKTTRIANPNATGAAPKKPGAKQQPEGQAAKPAAPKTNPRLAKQLEAKGNIERILGAKMTPESHDELLTHLGTLTVPQLKQIRQEQGLKAPTKLKADIVKNIAEHFRSKEDAGDGEKDVLDDVMGELLGGGEMPAEAKPEAKPATVEPRIPTPLAKPAKPAAAQAASAKDFSSLYSEVDGLIKEINQTNDIRASLRGDAPAKNLAKAEEIQSRARDMVKQMKAPELRQALKQALNLDAPPSWSRDKIAQTVMDGVVSRIGTAFRVDDGGTKKPKGASKSVLHTPLYRKALTSRVGSAGHVRHYLNGRRISLDKPAAPIPAPAETNNDDREKLEAIAEIIGGIYQDRALAMLGVEKSLDAFGMVLKAWDHVKHPRGPNGRFIPKGSSEAHAAAKSAIKTALSKPKTAETAKTLVEHLNILTVKQLHDLKKEYNLSASGETRDKLVAKLAERLGKGRSESGKAMTMDSPGFAKLLTDEALKLKDMAGRAVGDIGPGERHKVFISDLYDAVKDKIGNPSRDDFKKRLGKMLQTGEVELSRADLVGGAGYENDADKRKLSETYHPARKPDPFAGGSDADAHYFTVDPKAVPKGDAPKTPSYAEWAKGEREKNKAPKNDNARQANESAYDHYRRLQNTDSVTDEEFAAAEQAKNDEANGARSKFNQRVADDLAKQSPTRNAKQPAPKPTPIHTPFAKKDKIPTTGVDNAKGEGKISPVAETKPDGGGKMNTFNAILDEIDNGTKTEDEAVRDVMSHYGVDRQAAMSAIATTTPPEYESPQAIANRKITEKLNNPQPRKLTAKQAKEKEDRELQAKLIAMPIGEKAALAKQYGIDPTQYRSDYNLHREMASNPSIRGKLK